ncbi:MAG: hypothetical protein QF464_03970, partial [Myxococcota bacterium]|nr:hypothetical protein [Myxococcota bacterium]
MKPLLLLPLTAALLVGCGDTTVTSPADGDDVTAASDSVADHTGDVPDEAETTERDDDASGDDAGPDCLPLEAYDDPPPDEGHPDAPPEVLLTVNEIPASMNGSIPWTDDEGEAHDFVLRVNRERFTLDVMATEASGPIDWESLTLVCDQPLGAPDGGIWVAGTVIGGGDLETTTDGRRLRATPETATLPDLLVTCWAEVDGPHGSSASTVVFETATLEPHLDPFVTPDTWLIVLSRDIFSLEVTVHTDDTVTLTSTHVPEGDGVLDLDEALRALGIFSTENAEATAFVKAWLLEVVRDWVRQIFLLDSDGGMHTDSVPIQIVFEGEPGAPNPADYD